MAVGDPFKVAIVGAMTSQTIVNVFHYEQTTINTSGITESESLARAFNAGVVPAMQAIATEQSSWGVIEARTLPIPPLPPSGFDLTVAVLGTSENEPVPLTVAVVIRKKTAFLGRAYRGRNFFAGLPGDKYTASRVLESFMPTVQDLADAMLANLTWSAGGSPTFRPVIFAYTRNDLGVITGIRKTPLVSVQVDNVLRSQRRREVGVGA